MKITKFGAKSELNGIKTKIERSLVEYTTLVSILNSNEDLSYKEETVSSSIGTALSTGRLTIIKEGKAVFTVNEEFKNIVTDIYGLKVKK